MRRVSAVLLPGIGLWLSACASSGGQATPPRQLLLEAARECERGFVGVQVIGLDRFGQVEYLYQTADQRDEFIECWRQRARSKVEAAMAAISSGRLSRPPGSSGKTSVLIAMQGSAIMVPVRINDGGALVLLLDTGGDRTVLKGAATEPLGIRVPPSTLRWPFTLADGRVFHAPFVRLRSLQVGDLSIEDLDVAVHDILPDAPGVDGILGNDVLGHFRFDIDRQSGRLTLIATEPPGTTASVAPSSETGSPSATPLDWRPGYEWRFRWESPRERGAFVWTVTKETEVEGQQAYVVRSGSREIIFVRGTDRLGWLGERVDGAFVERASPPNYYLAWPLHVGKSWETTYTWENVSVRQTEERPRRCAVEDTESVTVPAGTFETFRVACRNRRGELRYMYWFAEKVRMFVKDRTVPFDGIVRDRELTDYRLD